ncbi:hypothetical protein KBC89_05035 [Candidatus Woesebacteria bacterium]|nr:hypothetical protein [Candidatus Woesebacteria bacterium]
MFFQLILFITKEYKNSPRHLPMAGGVNYFYCLLDTTKPLSAIGWGVMMNYLIVAIFH